MLQTPASVTLVCGMSVLSAQITCSPVMRSGRHVRPLRHDACAATNRRHAQCGTSCSYSTAPLPVACISRRLRVAAHASRPSKEMEDVSRMVDSVLYGSEMDDEEYAAYFNAMREQCDKEYTELKDMLWGRASRAGAFLTAYIFLVVSSEAALCSLIGSVGGLAYLSWLFRDVDMVDAQTKSHVFEADKIDNRFLRWGAKVVAAYRHGLNARLLVPVALGASIFLWNNLLSPGRPLSVPEEGCLLLGFLSYKAGPVLMLWDSYKPRVITAEERAKIKAGERPRLPSLPEDPQVAFRDERVNRLRF